MIDPRTGDIYLKTDNGAPLIRRRYWITLLMVMWFAAIVVT